MKEMPEESETMKSIVRISIIEASQYLKLFQTRFVPRNRRETIITNINLENVQHGEYEQQDCMN
jgi:hypothetical protein